MSKKKKNNEVLKQMRKIYYGDINQTDPHKDFMGYDIDDFNTPTYHHITLAQTLRSEHESDDATVENGAYLGTFSHSFLHNEIGKRDKELYEAWNKLFQLIVKKGTLDDEDIKNTTLKLQELSLKLANEPKKNHR